MGRIHDKNKSKLILGIEKVIDRQNAKPKINEVDFGMNTIKRYSNKTHCELNTIQLFYFPLKWQPLKYVIKKVPHTVYTYKIGETPISKEAVKRLKRKHINNIVKF